MRTRKRFVRRARRPMRKRFVRRSRVFKPRSVRNTVYNFKQSCELPNINVTAGTETFFTYGFKLNDVPQVNQFLAIYDNYRILAVRIMFYPEFNVAYAATVSSFAIPVLYTTFDPDGFPTLTGTGQLDQYQTTRRSLFNRMRTRYFKPFATYSATAFSGSSSVGNISSGLVPRRTWFNCAQSAITYNGIGGCITSSSPSQIPGQLVRVSAVYYLQFRNVQ